MALKLELADLNEIDEAVKPLYVKDGEVYRLEVDGLDDFVSTKTKGLEAKVSELLGETKAEKEKRRKLEAERQKADEDLKKQQGQFKELYEKTLTDLETERQTNSEFQRKIQKREVESVAAAIAGELTRDNARAKLLQKEALAFLRYDTESGSVKLENAGLSIEKNDLLEKLKKDYPFLADGKQASGGGASGGGHGAGNESLKRSKMSAKDKADFIRQHGQADFLKIPK